MDLAFLICVYRADSPSNFTIAVDSILKSKKPLNTKVNIYLHIDGDIPSELEKAIESFSFYKVVKSDKNVGLAIGLNKLISILEDESYVFRMDSDDIMSADRIEKQVDYLEANKSVDFIGSNMKEFVGDKSNIVSHRKYPEKNLINYMCKAAPFAHPTMCFRRNFFSKFGEYPVDYPLNEDIAFWSKALLNGAVGTNIQSVLLYYRADTSYNRRSYSKAVSELRVYFTHCLKLKKLPILPFVRFVFRLFPRRLIKTIYQSKVREIFLNNKSS